MGQQQLLLIVLGVIIVGVAVVVGISMFNSSAESAAKDSVASEMLNLGATAQQYYKRPQQLGGGGGSFVGVESGKISASLLTTDNATYTVAAGTATSVTITAVPKGGYAWRPTATVSSTNVSLTGL